MNPHQVFLEYVFDTFTVLGLFFLTIFLVVVVSDGTSWLFQVKRSRRTPSSETFLDDLLRKMNGGK